MGSYIKYIVLGMLITLVPIIAIALLTEPEATYVLGQATSVPSPSPSLSPSPTPSPSPTIEPSPTPTPTPKPVFPPVSSEEINGFIDRFASQYGVDPNVLRYIALCESGFNPQAVNWIYAGLYQFGPVTWRNIRAEIGEDIGANLRYSAEESIQTAAYALSKGKIGIWPNCKP